MYLWKQPSVILKKRNPQAPIAASDCGANCTVFLCIHMVLFRTAGKPKFNQEVKSIISAQALLWVLLQVSLAPRPESPLTTEKSELRASPTMPPRSARTLAAVLGRGRPGDRCSLAPH